VGGCSCAAGATGDVPGEKAGRVPAQVLVTSIQCVSLCSCNSRSLRVLCVHTCSERLVPRLACHAHSTSTQLSYRPQSDKQHAMCVG
jgi:hypothetical protein